ncbi:MAG: super-infection exclusion protein B [Candidatus Electrothrix communis]|nr:MAG: super-infection exclusion protein B [Candidatus Electrothrix communis]
MLRKLGDCKILTLRNLLLPRAWEVFAYQYFFYAYKMNIENIIGWLKLSVKHIFPVFLITGVLLFIPTAQLTTFGVDVFVTTYRMWIGLAFLTSGTLLISHFVFWLKDKLVEWWRIRNLKRTLLNLSPEEKSILADYILLQTKSQQLSFLGGIANGLERNHLIYRSSNLGSIYGFAYNIQPWAWEEFNKHPQLLEPQLSSRRQELKGSGKLG